MSWLQRRHRNYVILCRRRRRLDVRLHLLLLRMPRCDHPRRLQICYAGEKDLLMMFHSRSELSLEPHGARKPWTTSPCSSRLRPRPIRPWRPPWLVSEPEHPSLRRHLLQQPSPRVPPSSRLRKSEHWLCWPPSPLQAHRVHLQHNDAAVRRLTCPYYCWM